MPEPSIPLHREGVAESVGATERLNQLRMKLKATVQLNTQLTEKINLLKVYMYTLHVVVSFLCILGVLVCIFFLLIIGRNCEETGNFKETKRTKK